MPPRDQTPPTATISVVIDGARKSADMADPQASEALIAEYVRQNFPLAEGAENGMGKSARDVLRNYIARIERVEIEQAELAADKTEIYQEVKIFGFDVSIVRRMIKLRKMEEAARQERDALTEIYMNAINGGDEDGADIPLPGLPAAKKARKASQARIKKEAARDAALAREKAAAEAARKAFARISGADAGAAT